MANKVNQISSTAVGVYNGVVGLATSIPLAGLDVASSVQKGACGVFSTGITTARNGITGIGNILKMNGGR